MRTGLAFICLILCYFFYSRVDAQTARASLINTQGDTVGNVIFTQTDSGVILDITISDLPEGAHSLHIHEQGKCATPGFESAGGHFNPSNREHGFLNPRGPHAGDLPNIVIGANRRAQKRIRTKLISLRNGQSNSLLKEGGTSVVIHERPDDYVTDPAGGGGSRIACGVIIETANQKE